MAERGAVGGWIPRRDEGLRRLEEFLPRAGQAYAKLRNYDRGPAHHTDVSTLSPWIRHRLVLEEEVVSAVLARHSFSAAEKFIQEVFWRTYWKGWLELRPVIWRDYRLRVRRLVDEIYGGAGLRDRWEEATIGRTGVECFDAWSRELIETGYLHNHARMWFASIWIFTLDLPWELGADFFLRHLLDGDPASNTLSWRWVAGLQTRGKTYLARPGNIAKFTNGRFHPINQLATVSRPLSEPAPPAPKAPPLPVAWDSERPTGLLVTEEDLQLDFLLTDGNSRFRSVAAIGTSEGRSPLGVPSPVLNFVDGAIRDTLDRLESQGYRTMGIFHGSDLPGQIVDWASREGLRQVVTAYVPIGPTAEIVQTLADRLAERGIALIAPLRPWDQLAWPHATRGFFQFREKIPAILREMDKIRLAAL